MSNTKDSHWRKVMNTKFLSGDELEKDGQIVTIESYNGEEFFSPKTKTKEDHVVLKFKELSKSMILTNRKAKQISNVLNTPLMDEWVGRKIKIYPNQEKHFGEFFPVINIKEGKVEKEKLTPKHPKWDGAKKSLVAGSVTIEQIKSKYELSDKDEKLLTDGK